MKFKIINIMAVWLVIALLLTGCNKEEKTHLLKSADKQVEITTPSTWEISKKDKLGANVILSAFSNDNKNGIVIFKVKNDEFFIGEDNKELTLTEATDEQLLELLQLTKDNAKILPSEKIDEKLAKFVEVSSEKDGNLLQMLVEHDDSIYVVIIGVKEKKSYDQKKFMEILRTFKIKN